VRGFLSLLIEFEREDPVLGIYARRGIKVGCVDGIIIVVGL